MSRFRKIESHLHQLTELKTIITSMKTIAQLELRKLGKLTENQNQLLQILERTVSDFLRYYPQPRPAADRDLLLLIGSERGLCGGFNRLLVERFLAAEKDVPGKGPHVLAVGAKLCRQLGERLPGFTALAGAGTGEEIPAILTEAIAAMTQLQYRHNLTGLRVFYHNDGHGTVVDRRMLPPDGDIPQADDTSCPLLYLPPSEFYHDFLQHYLYLGLTGLFTVSLLAENRCRVQHLGGAEHRLDDRLNRLRLQARTLRQEEITEEIEMILLGSGAFDLPDDAGKPTV